MSDALTRGVHHVGLTVTSLNRTRDFFIEVLGFTQVGEKPEYPAAFISDGTMMITLWQAANPITANTFDRHNTVGLHHLALAVEDADSLERLHQRLRTTNGVYIEFPPEALGAGPAVHMMCSIPGGLRVEFIAVSTA